MIYFYFIFDKYKDHCDLSEKPIRNNHFEQKLIDLNRKVEEDRTVICDYKSEIDNLKQNNNELTVKLEEMREDLKPKINLSNTTLPTTKITNEEPKVELIEKKEPKVELIEKKEPKVELIEKKEPKVEENKDFQQEYDELDDFNVKMN